MFDNKKELKNILTNAKHNYQTDNKEKYKNNIILSIDILKQARDTNEILKLEAICIDIYDTNFVCSNINKINSKLLACYSAIKEFDLFNNNKELFLKQFQESRITDINADSFFEKSVKEIIRYLGSEKNVALRENITNKFFEARQDNLRNITINFTKERIDFLSKHCNQKKHQVIQKNKGFER